MSCRMQGMINVHFIGGSTFNPEDFLSNINSITDYHDNFLKKSTYFEETSES